MASREIKAEHLRQGQVILLAMGHQATVTEPPKVGRTFVSFKTEHGTTRVRVGDSVLIDDTNGEG